MGKMAENCRCAAPPRLGRFQAGIRRFLAPIDKNPRAAGGNKGTGGSARPTDDFTGRSRRRRESRLKFAAASALQLALRAHRV
jgi:hypothetical protein